MPLTLQLLKLRVNPNFFVIAACECRRWIMEPLDVVLDDPGVRLPTDIDPIVVGVVVEPCLKS